MAIRNLQTKRYMNFSQDGKDIVDAGIELYKHYLFANKGKKEYAEFATGRYDEKQKVFSDSLVKEAIKIAGVSQVGFSNTQIMQNPTVKWAMFSVVSEILDVIIPDTVLDNFYQFADVKNVAWGDNLKFTVPNPSLFVVSTFADGIVKGEPQRLYNSDVVLNPIGRTITIEEDFYRVIAGKVNWGDWVTRVAQSFETQLTVDIYTSLFNTYANLPTNLKVAGFTQDAYVQLAQRVQGLNRGSQVVVFGTKVGLSKVLPTDTTLRQGLGVEYVKNGYIADAFGIPAFEIDQKIVPNADTFAIDDNTLYFVSMGSDKLVKVGFEGEALINSADYTKNADMTQEYTIFKKYDVKVATSARYGILKLS